MVWDSSRVKPPGDDFRIRMANSTHERISPAAVVIATKNRIDDLRKAVASALAQTARPEVLVMNDGSTDNTAEAIAREFPEVRLHSASISIGYIAQRNRAAELVNAPIVFSIDDDAAFSSPRVVEQTLAEFDDPRVGAVAIPFIDVNQGPAVKQRAPDKSRVYAAYSFIGTAHALRRDLFLALGGYREILVHQGEEEDYSTRMLNAGYITRHGTADPINHFESPRRCWARMDYYGPRNKILHSWHNVPLPFFPAHLVATTARTLAHDLRPDRFWTRLRGVLAGYAMGLTGRTMRVPVARDIYRLSRELKGRGPVAFSDIAARLPEIRPLRTRENTLVCAG